MNKHLLYIVSALMTLLPASLYAQDGATDVPVKTDLSDPDLIVRPPTDPYSLSFTPPMPEGAENIINAAQCKDAGGEWLSGKTKQSEENGEKLVGCLKKKDQRVGRWMRIDLQTPPEEVNEDNAWGYVWFVDDAMHGWAVSLDPETRTVVQLASMDHNVSDGTRFDWSKVGSLEAVTTYKQGKLDGKYERYLECLPLVIGQYKDGEPVGIWQIYDEPGLIGMRRDFDRPIPVDERPAGMDPKNQAYWTEWFNASGVKISEGYSVSEKPDDNGFRVGTLMMYSVSGQKWMKLSYDGNGKINDKRMFDLCKPDNQPNAPIPAYLDFDHEALAMNCKDGDGNPYLKIDFYAGGELRKKTPMSALAENGTVKEYHPTGELMAEYEMVNDVPDGVVVFVDRHGNIMGNTVVNAGTGIFKTWWHNGNPHEEREYAQGKKTGTWSEWLESGVKSKETQYKDGMINGYRRQWFLNGILSVEQLFVNGVNEGLTFYNYSDGRIADECMFRSGMPTGICKEYAHSGNLSYETDYSNFLNITQNRYYSDGKKRSSGRIIPGFGHGSREGNWDFYLKNGQKWLSLEYSGNAVVQPDAMACSEISGAEYTVDEETRELGCMVCSVNRASPLNPLKIREGHWNWYNDNGKIEKSGSIHLGHLNGDWEYYYPNGEKMLTGTYRIDQRVGKWSGYYEDGSQKFSGMYEDGLESGLWETYYPLDGKVSSAGMFKAGRRDGEWVYKYPNGAVKEKGTFENGLENGIWTSFYENGQKQGEGAFKEGKREGTWTWFREDGSVWRTAEYQNGKEIKK